MKIKKIIGALTAKFAVALMAFGLAGGAWGATLPSADANGVITLTGNLTLTSENDIPDNKILDLGGHTLTLQGGSLWACKNQAQTATIRNGTIDVTSGSSPTALTLGSQGYSGTKAVVSNVTIKLNSTWSATAIKVSWADEGENGAPSIVLKDVTITGSGSSQTGMYFYNTEGVEIDNCSINLTGSSGAFKCAYQSNPSNPGPHSSITVKNSTLSSKYDCVEFTDGVLNISNTTISTTTSEKNAIKTSLSVQSGGAVPNTINVYSGTIINGKLGNGTSGENNITFYEGAKLNTAAYNSVDAWGTSNGTAACAEGCGFVGPDNAGCYTVGHPVAQVFTMRLMNIKENISESRDDVYLEVSYFFNKGHIGDVDGNVLSFPIYGSITDDTLQYRDLDDNSFYSAKYLYDNYIAPGSHEYYPQTDVLYEYRNVAKSSHETFEAAIAAVEEGETIVVVNYNAETMTAPKGWQFVTENDVTTLVPAPATPYVARVISSDGATTNEYVNLMEAIDVAYNGGTVELLMDVTINRWHQNVWSIEDSDQVEYTGNRAVTGPNGLVIHGNNHTVTVNSIDSGMNGDRLFCGGNLTMSDITFNVTYNGTEGHPGGINIASGTLTRVNIIINGAGVPLMPSSNCASADNYSSSIQGITVEDCVFDAGSGNVLYVAENGSAVNLVVRNSTLKTTSTSTIIILRSNEVIENCKIISGNGGKITVTTGTLSPGFSRIAGPVTLRNNDFTGTGLKIYSDALVTAGAITGNIFSSTSIIKRDGTDVVDLSANYWGDGSEPVFAANQYATYTSWYTATEARESTTGATRQVADIAMPLVDYVTLTLAIDADYAAAYPENVAAARAMYEGVKYESLAAAQAGFAALFGWTGTGFANPNNAPFKNAVASNGPTPVTKVTFDVYGTTAVGTSNGKITLGNFSDSSLYLMSVDLVGHDGAEISGEAEISAKVAGGYDNHHTTRGKFFVTNIVFTTSSDKVEFYASCANIGATEKVVEPSELEVVGCTFHTKVYEYSNSADNGKMTYSFHDNVFISTGSETYALHIQTGVDMGPDTINFYNNIVSNYVRGININVFSSTQTKTANIYGNTFYPGVGYSAVQLSTIDVAFVTNNVIYLNAGNAITLHENLNDGAVVHLDGNTIAFADGASVGYIVYDDAYAGNNADALARNLTMTYTDNTVAEGISTTQGVKGANAYGLREYVYNVLNPATYVAQIIRNNEILAQYETITAAFGAAQNGDIIELLSDAELSAPTRLENNGTYVVDGKGFTISPAANASFGSDGALDFGHAGVNSDSTVDTAKVFTLTNAVIAGFNSEIIRCEGCVLTIADCVFTNNNITVNSGRGKHLVRIACSTAAIQSSIFTDNAADGYGVIYIDEQHNNIQVRNCLFKDNVVDGTAVIDVAHCESMSIVDSTFEHNTLNSSNNGAVVYLGAKDGQGDNGGDCTGCLFKDNVVNYTTTSGYDDRIRAAGAIFTWAYGDAPGTISGNAFVNNSVVKQSANVLSCYAKSIFSGGKYNAQDLAGNYFGGSAPKITQNDIASSGNDIYAELSTYAVTASTYAESYTLNDNNYGVTVTLYVPPVAQVISADGALVGGYATFRSAIEAVNASGEAELTLKLLTNVNEPLTSDLGVRNTALTITSDVEGGVELFLQSSSGYKGFTAETGATVTIMPSVKVTGIRQIGAYGSVDAIANLNNPIRTSQLILSKGTVNINPDARIRFYDDGAVHFWGGSYVVNGSLAAGEGLTATIESVGADNLQWDGGYVNYRYNDSAFVMSNAIIRTQFSNGAAHASNSTVFDVSLNNSVIYATGSTFALGGAVAGTLTLNGSRIVAAGAMVTNDANDGIVMDWRSSITAKNFVNSGTVAVDMTGFDGELPLTLITTTDADAVLGDFEVINNASGATLKLDANGNIVAVKAVAKIGDRLYGSLGEAIAAAQDGDTVEIVADIAGETVTVSRNVTVTGASDAEGKPARTLTDTVLTLNGTTVELAVTNLAFTGSSYINANNGKALTVDHVTAVVDPTKCGICSRSAFIVLSATEHTTGLDLTVTHSTIVNTSGTDSYGAAIFGWAYLKSATICDNVLGSDSYRFRFIAVKLMNAVDGATYMIERNVVYGTNADYTFYGFDLYQNNSRNNSYTAVSKDNVFNVTATESNRLFAFRIERNGDASTKTIVIDSDSTLKGEAVTLNDFLDELNVNAGFYGAGVVYDANGKMTAGTFNRELSDAELEEFVAEGLRSFAVGDGTYTLDVPVAQIGTTYYATFAEAIAAAGENDEIIVLDDTATVPAGWKFVTDSGTGVTTLVRKVYVAQIGTTEYTSLFDAAAAVSDGDTITMIADSVETREVVFAFNGSATLDLNGHTVSANDDIWVKTGNITVVGGAGSAVTSTGYGFYVSTNSKPNNAATLTIDSDNVTVTAGTYGVVVMSGGSFNLVNGHIVSDSEFAVCGHGTATNVTINISGGSILGNGTIGVYFPPAGTLNISGGTITGTTAIYQKCGTMTITGGTILGTGTAAEYAYKDSGANATGDAVVLDNCNYPNGVPSATITGGTFISANAQPIASYAGNGETELVLGFVSGGYLSSVISAACCASDYLCTTKPVANGMYQVVPAATVTYTLAAGDDSAIGAALPSPASFAYPSGDLAEIALAVATCTDDDYTFGGWQMTVGDKTKVVSALPAGTTGNVTLVATWTRATKIQIDADGDSSTPLNDIKVTDEWIAYNVNVDEGATPEEKNAAIKQALETQDNNGFKKWENYVLGLDANAKVGAVAEQGLTTMMPVESTVRVTTVDTGFTVKYQLNEVDEAGETVTGGAGTPQDSPELSVDLSTVESNAYYKVVATIKSPEGETMTTATSENIIGVLKVESSVTTTAVAVPWASYDGTGPISVADIVRTANLTEGDSLKAYDPDSKTYKEWTLGADKTWQPSSTYSTSGTTSGSESAGNADAYKVARGSAVWLTRDDPSQPIYLVGGAASGTVETELEAAPSETKSSWNLVGNPKVESVDVKNLLGAKTGDQVIVPTAGAPKNYVFVEGKGWGYYTTEPVYKSGKQVGVRSVFKTDDTYVPAGTGFWYLNSSTSEDAKINW